MSKRQYELVTHVFIGGRFDDHGVDVDVLPDLITYKMLLVETAKELWRLKHPDRQRLPKNFEDSLSLKFYSIDPGSAAIPLVREIEQEELALFNPALEPPRDELDEAVELIAKVIQAVSKDQPVPESFPKAVIPIFSEYGKTLREGESIELKPAKIKLRVRYSTGERDRLLKLAQAEYEDVVNLVGEIRAADLDGYNFALRLPDGTKVIGKFTPDQEATIVDALKEHVTRRLHIKGRAEFWPNGKLKRIVSITALLVQPTDTVPYDASARPIWELAEEISASVPDEEWKKLPTDLSKNLDHYLYGAPKRN